MPKFVHTADWHVGKSRFIPDYLQRQINGIKFAYDTAIKNNCDFVLCSGDLVERVVLKPEEKDALLDLLAYYDKEGIKTYIITGNHDRISPEYTNLHFIQILTKNHFKNIVVAVNDPLTIELDNDWFLGLVPYANYDQESFNVTVQMMIKRMKRKGIISFHAMLLDSMTDLGHKFTSGFTLPDFDEIKYWALGDIHRFQKMRENAFYSGPPIQHDFGEHLPKGVVLVDLQEKLDLKLIEIDGVKPLLTVEENENIPDNAWVRVRGSVKTLESAMPRNVLKTQVITPTSKKVDIHKVEDPISGLEDILKNQGITDIDETVKLARELLKET